MPMAKHDGHHPQRRLRADLVDVLEQQLDRHEREHDRDRLVEVAEALDHPLDEHEQRAQAEQGEHVAHPDQHGVARDGEGGGDRVDGEGDVGGDDGREADEQRRHVALAVLPQRTSARRGSRS